MKAPFKFIRSRFSLELQVHTVSLTREAVGEAAGKGRRVKGEKRKTFSMFLMLGLFWARWQNEQIRRDQSRSYITKQYVTR